MNWKKAEPTPIADILKARGAIEEFGVRIADWSKLENEKRRVVREMFLEHGFDRSRHLILRRPSHPDGAGTFWMIPMEEAGDAFGMTDGELRAKYPHVEV